MRLLAALAGLPFLSRPVGVTTQPCITPLRCLSSLVHFPCGSYMLDYGTIWRGTLLVCLVAPPIGG